MSKEFLINENDFDYYWNSPHTILDIMSNELAFCMIFNDLKPGKLDLALSTVGLEMPPNRFFLIQVDSYDRAVSNLTVPEESYLKTNLIIQLRDLLQHSNIPNFFGNLIGSDQFICFICCKESTETKKQLMHISASFINLLHSVSKQTISICISSRCDQWSDYCSMLPKMKASFQNGYYYGRECILYLDDYKGFSTIESNPSIDQFYPDIVRLLSKNEIDQLDAIFEKILPIFLKSNVRPQVAKMKFLRLLQKIETFGIQCGIPEIIMVNLYENTSYQIMLDSFISESFDAFRGYCCLVSDLLKNYSNNMDLVFSIPVKEYIVNRYNTDISLKEISDFIGFSEGHFARVFRKSFGKSFIEYLNSYRITQSKYLLEQTDMTISMIANHTGFNSYSYYCSCFKDAYGISPKAYREQYLEQITTLNQNTL